MERFTHVVESRIASTGYRQSCSMSLRSRRKSLAQGKRSETKWSEAQPWVPLPNESKARFSGRQISTETHVLSPAKAGLTIISDRDPGLRSLRSRHPGLD